MMIILILIWQWLNGAINFDKEEIPLTILCPEHVRVVASDENVRWLETVFT